jgi:hypothetical protein
MESLARFYTAVAHDIRGERKRYTLIFSNVSEKERDYLLELGVNEKHIKGIRPEPEEESSVERALIPQPNPTI